MCIRKKLGGLILLSMGVGILIGLVIPGIGFLIAGAMICMGFIYIFI